MLNSLSLVAATGSSGLPTGLVLAYAVVVVIAILAAWKVYSKAGKPGWAAIIPIYNAYVLLKIVGRPGWWLLLMLIPFVNVIVALVVAIDLAKSFGKGTVFGVLGLFLFSFIGYLMLAFGDATYQGPAAAGGAASAPAPSQPAPAEPAAAEEAPAEAPAAEEEETPEDNPPAPKPPVVQ